MATDDPCSGDLQKLAGWIHTACVIEATARKPGNVHPDAQFADLTYADFVRSAEVVAPILARAAAYGVGATIRDAVQITDDVVGKNTNLGIILLLAPLAAVPLDTRLGDGIPRVLSQLTQFDAQQAYRAIRTAAPAGMGAVVLQDVSQSPSVTLLGAMQMAAGYDSVARQYVNEFHDVLSVGVPLLSDGGHFGERWEEVVIFLHLQLMSRWPDTLIARKCGIGEAETSAELAHAVLESGWPSTKAGKSRLQELDYWLRSKGNQRNPGTTADMVTACLFAAFRDGHTDPPKLDQVLHS